VFWKKNVAQGQYFRTEPSAAPPPTIKSLDIEGEIDEVLADATQAPS